MIENFLGSIILTHDQIMRLSTLHSATVKGFSVRGSNVSAFTDSPMSESDKITLAASVQNLSTSPLPQESDKTDYQSSPIFGMTPTQVATWVINNVTDLASAKTVIAELAKTVMYLIRKSDLQ